MERFDAIVIGAGPAGSTAAYRMAQGGLKVLLVERAKVPGGKNLFGGRIYSHILRKYFGNFESEAPVERFVVRETIGLMDEFDCASIDFASRRSEANKASSFIARRSRFDRWLSEKAETAGALLVPGTKVEGLTVTDGAVRGIVSGGDSIESDCVVNAEGVTATIARKAGLRNDVFPSQVKVGVKETIELGKGVINDRFNISDDEGAAGIFIGHPASYLTASGSFVYTNSDSVSIGVVVDPVELSNARKDVQQIIEEFRLHPYMQRLLKGGKIIEYSAHMIPNSVPLEPSNLVGNGFLNTGDAAGLFANHAFTYRGVDFAIASGFAAADAVITAHSSGSYGRESLMSYYNYLAREVIPELRRAEKAAGVLHNRRIFSAYPPFVLDFLEDMFRFDGVGKTPVSSSLKKNMKGRISMLTALRDMMSAYRKL